MQEQEPVKWITYLKCWTVSVMTVVFFSTCHHTQGNRLQYAASPYLREHADNPVDWYEWGEEALQKAQKENKPLIVSVGYASCHWCHQMEEESFMDTAVANFMNANFVCIKVDREERPDIDNLYMNALQLLSGNSGWPLNAFALPDGKPFFAGTYFPRNNWLSLLKEISKTYRTKNKLVITQANALVNGLKASALSFNADNDKIAGSLADTKKLNDSISSHIDGVYGGIKGQPKFPMPVLPEYLLQYGTVNHDTAAWAAALLTLKKMATGGIYDHAGGGFARYTTDSNWHTPHFEKMLCDNGQLLSVYAHAYQLTKDPFYKMIIEETAGFAARSLQAENGGYYSSLNADTEEGEGIFYQWTFDEFMKVTGNASLAATYYNVVPGGKKIILHAAATPAEFAAVYQISPADFLQTLATVKQKLITARNKRKQPTADTKIIAAWNGMMIRGLADAYTATGNIVYLQKAKDCAAFIEKELLGADGSLKRIFFNGKSRTAAFLEDYAWISCAFTQLYQVSFEKRWLLVAKKLADFAIQHFRDNTSGLFYFTGKENSGALFRDITVTDESIPSANAIMAKELYTLGVIYGNSTYQQYARQMIGAAERSMLQQPLYHLSWCMLVNFLSAASYEVVITGKDAVATGVSLQGNYLPNSIFMGAVAADELPLLKDKLVPGQTTIYVCTNSACKRPETSVEKALLLMK